MTEKPAPPPATLPPDVRVYERLSDDAPREVVVVLAPRGPLSRIPELASQLVMAVGTLGTAALLVGSAVPLLVTVDSKLALAVAWLSLLAGALLVGVLAGMGLSLLVGSGLALLLDRTRGERLRIRGQRLLLHQPAGVRRLSLARVLSVEEAATAVHLVLPGGQKVPVARGRDESTRVWLAELVRQHLQRSPPGIEAA